MQDHSTQEQIKQLVLARLHVMPPDANISVGSEGEFTRDQLIQHVENNDDVGKKITAIEMEYLRLLKEGIFYGNSANN